MYRTLGSILVVFLLPLAGCGSGGDGGRIDCRAEAPSPCTCADGRSGGASCGNACDCDPDFALVAEPATLAFGVLGQGASRDAVVLLRNPAPRAVRLASVGFVDETPGTFALPDVAPATLPAGGSAALTVRFTAGEPGPVEARLRVVPDDAGVAPVEVAVSAGVSGAVVSCAPAAVSFPNTWIGGPSSVRVTCSNAGDPDDGLDAIFPLDALELEGEGFEATWWGGRPSGIWPGHDVTLTVTFDPGAAGAYRGALILGGSHGHLTIPLSGIALETPACDLELPDPLHVAITEPGGSTGYPLEIRNRRADAPCFVDDVRLCAGTDPAFGVAGGTNGRMTLPGGGTLTLRVGFHPTYWSCHGGPVGCVEFRVEPSPDGYRSIPVSCEAPDYPRQYVYPSEVDFGEVTVGCRTVDRTLEVNNITAEPIHLGAIEVDEGATDEFFVRSWPPFGTELLPGHSVSITLAYRPEDYGDDVGAVLVGIEELPEPLLVPLRGRGGGDVPVRDTFHQNLPPKVDLLFVIDNGAAMAPEAARVIAELGGVPDRLVAQGLDFHLAVTTTGLEPGGAGCPGGVSGGEDGRLFPVDGSRPRILDATTPDLRATWEANLAVGTCQSAAPQALEAMVRAVTPPVSTDADDPRHAEPHDGNLGFWRQDARLEVVAVSNRSDASPGTAPSYLNTVQDLKGFRNWQLFGFDAITGDRASGCPADGGRWAAPGDALIGLVERTPGGTFVSFCGTGWLDALLPGTSPGWMRTCFFLATQPSDPDGDGVIDEDALHVWVDGAEVPSVTDGERAWGYARDQVAVCFEEDHLPPPGTQVEIEYPVSGCDPWDPY